MSEVVLEMTFIKNYDYFEELQNWLENFRCLLYAQHVNLLCAVGVELAAAIVLAAEEAEVVGRGRRQHQD